MKVALITPWKNAWVPLYCRAFEDRGHGFGVYGSVNDDYGRAHMADVILHGWSSGEPLPGKKNIMFLRRYELFGEAQKVDWSHVDHLICVNKWIKDIADDCLRGQVPTHLIYNAVDESKWTYKDRKPNHRVGMACHVHPKKNLPLALQILALLPTEYELHIAGEIQDPWTAEYLNDMAVKMRRKVFLHGHVQNMDAWWEQMGCCLSTSISEGNPNNVLEAMAKGIKCIVHDWPGAEDQFPDWMRFETAGEAANLISVGLYRSSDYLNIVREKFSLNNIEKVVDLCEF